MGVELAPATGRPLPSTAPPPRRSRPSVLLTGTSLAAAGSVMFFACLIGVYLAQRAQAIETGAWLPEGAVIPLTPANMAMVTILMAGFTVQWAVYAIKNDDRQSSYVALGLSMLLALAFVNEIAVLYTRMGLVLADSIAGTLIYTISGAHLAMVLVAVLYLAVMAFRALGGQYSPEDNAGLQAAAIYWYATVGVYALIWYSIYITK
jgi:heme/copper-type cytochrome/quinol oxidase subunit 3